MTTIAYKDGVVAYDSRCCSGMTICDDDFDKHREANGVHYFLAGSVDMQDVLIAAYKDKTAAKALEGSTASAIVVDSGEIYTVYLDESSPLSINRDRIGNVIAIGSGERHALTAMDMGATAKEAVKMAMKRDAGTGGRIRTFKVF